MQAINCYVNVHSPSIQKTININDWFNQIKNTPEQFLLPIKNARNLDRTKEIDNLEYNKIKCTVLPCVTYNFKFNKKLAAKNIIDSTGFLFIDIDISNYKNSDFDIEKIDKNKIFAYYHSLGGIGYSLIVKVNGLTYDNFKEAYNYISYELNITNFIDKGAAKPTQYNVLSYDENIFINENCFTFNINEKTVQCVQFLNKYSTKSNKEKHLRTTCTVLDSVRFNNIKEISNELTFNEQHYVTNFEGGWQHIMCNTPLKTTKIGRRKTTLLAYYTNLVWLNQNNNRNGLFKILIGINELFETPMLENEIYEIHRTVYKYLDDGTLKPIYAKKNRKLIFDSENSLSKKEKLEIVLEVFRTKKINETKEKIELIVDNWGFSLNGKISQSKIAKMYNMSKSTLVKYWYLVNEKVIENNKNYKIDIKNYGKQKK